MNYFNKFLYLTAVVAASMLFTFCSEDDKNVTPTPTEYVATSATFANWNTWTLVDTRLGPDPALGEMAHGGQGEGVTRKIYIKEDKAKVNGQFPIGTVVVKHTTNSEGTLNEITAMVKRGGDGFNTGHNGWEWFMLMPDGTVSAEMRGADLMNGMCNMCHSNAKAKDYVFSKN